MSILAKLAVASALFAAGLAVGVAAEKNGAATAQATVQATVKVAFENPRVAVRVIDMPPGASRPGRTRPTDELVLFCDEAHYQAVDAQGKKEARDRAPGAVVWHSKGELAPTLVNTSARTVHYYGISLK
jgi:hypothetical protein